MGDVKPQVVVLGIGNPLRRDDGAGICVIHMLWQKEPQSAVKLIDGGTSPDLPSLLEPSLRKLIIVDALQGGREPGHIYRLELDESNLSEQAPASLHGLGVLNGLRMMRALGRQPQSVVLIGIEPLDTSHGLHLSPLLEARLPDLVTTIEKECGLSY